MPKASSIDSVYVISQPCDIMQNYNCEEIKVQRCLFISDMSKLKLADGEQGTTSQTTVNFLELIAAVNDQAVVKGAKCRLKWLTLCVN